MKILHIETGRFFYGGPQQVLYLCSGLKNLGFKNILVCSLESDLGKIAKEQGIRVIEVRCKGDLDIFFALRLSKIINNECPDIIHCHSRRGADFLGGMVAYWYGIPAILSRRVDSLESNLINKLRNILFLKTIAISKNIYNILSLSGIKSDQLSLIRSAVDSTRFFNSYTKEEFLDRFNLNENDCVIVSVGQLIPRKGHDFLIKSMVNLRELSPRIKLIIFGQGQLNGKLKKLITRLNLDDCVRLAGFDLELDDYLPHFKLLAHAASAEGLGVILMKAGAAGLPVVAFNAGGISEVIKNGVTGLLSEVGDQSTFENNINSIINDEVLRGNYSSAAKQFIKIEYSLQPMLNKHIQLYESIYNERIK